jgi:quinol monooxygenase YgiN
MYKKDTTLVVCVAEFQAKEGKTEALMTALHSLIQPTLQEPGCIRYELNQRTDDPRRITFIEQWRDKQVFEEHCAKPYIANFFEAVRPDLGKL